MRNISLNGVWQLTGTSPAGETLALSAAVPGSTLYALEEARVEGEHADPFFGKNADVYQKYEEYTWLFEKSFSLPCGAMAEKGRFFLRFARLDTYCDCYLNGKHVATTDNGHIAYSLDVTEALAEGENLLQLYFASPIAQVRGKRKREGAFTTERLYTRRPQCTYGWDWTARFISCAVGDAELAFEPDGFRFGDAYVYTKTVDEDGAAVGADITFACPTPGCVLAFSVCDPDGKTVCRDERFCAEPFLRLTFDVPAPRLWFPRGYGEQPSYTFRVSCGDEILYETAFGIRTLRILQLRDEPGTPAYERCLSLKTTEFSARYDENTEFSGFILKVNGKRILCKGANWVPCEPFSRGNTDTRVDAILSLAAEGGVNMIRVWGGGSFETAHFYRECSRLGILVTQDFLMACGAYPEDETWFIEQLRREATYAAHLIRNEACLAWWSGDNENAVNGSDTDTDYRGRRSAYQGIAPILYREDPYRAFLPSSPFGGRKYASNTVGTTHNTQYLSVVFNYFDAGDLHDYKSFFEQMNARFVAEEPNFGAAALPSLKRFMTEEVIFSEDLSMWLYHTKGNPSLRKELFTFMLEFTEGLLGKFQNPRDRYFKMKAAQCEWVRFSVERVRREKWFSSGVIFWMLNDCWPAASGWSLIDYYAMPKPAFYAFRRAAKPQILSVRRQGDEYEIRLCNDGAACAGEISLHIIEKGGARMRALAPITASAPENESVLAARLPASVLGEGEVLVADWLGEDAARDRTFYREGALPICPCDVTVTAQGADFVTVRAAGYAHIVELCADAVFEENVFSLLPGEEKTVRFRAAAPVTVTAEAYTVR